MGIPVEGSETAVNGQTPAITALLHLPSEQLLAVGLLSISALLKRSLEGRQTLRPSERESIINALSVLETIHLRWSR